MDKLYCIKVNHPKRGEYYDGAVFNNLDDAKYYIEHYHNDAITRSEWCTIEELPMLWHKGPNGRTVYHGWDISKLLG